MIADAADIRHGTKIGRFVVTGELGKGGMGVVFSAHDPELDRKVALKVLRSSGATEEERVRMLREGQAMARVTHPNVITVYEVGVQDTLVFLAQELLDAGTLGDWLDHPHTEAEILDKFVAAGRGLAAAHAAGLVHRDFKPDNVLLGSDGRVRVADFGLARALGAEDALGLEDTLPAETRANIARARLEMAVSPMSPLTRTGAVMGTPMYMAPEQHLGDRADERSDQFAFCVALYKALYGQWPYAGETAPAIANNVIKGRLQPLPKSAKVAPRLREIVLRGLSTKPADRYPSIDALLADLTRPPSRTGRQVALVIALLAVVGGAGVGVYLITTRGRSATALAPADLVTEKGAAYLTTAIERGELDRAIAAYDDAAQDATEAPPRAIASASGAILLALRGKLDDARTHLRSAASNDPLGAAYAQLARGTIALADGHLASALSDAKLCAGAALPALAAMCDQLAGDAAAETGDTDLARKSYAAGIALAPHPLTLELALAGLDLDADKADAAASAAKDVQEAASDNGAVAVVRAAWVLLGRAHIATAATAQASGELDHVKTVEHLSIDVMHQIAAGQATALLGDTEDGLAKIDAAKKQAEDHGFPGLVLAARLARAETMVTLSLPDADAQRKSVIADANAKGYHRIAHLAETIDQR